MSTFFKKEVFSREDLWEFARKLNPQLSQSQLNYIILDLKRKGKLRDVGRGVYAVGDKVGFYPPVDKMMTTMVKHLKEVMSTEAPYTIWSTEWLNDFMELQATSVMYILELEREDINRAFYLLRDHFSFVFANPDQTVIETYISGLPEAIIIWPLLSRAPLDTSREVVFPSLEKILVDLYCDTDLFFAYQGYQLVQIYQAAFSKYPINFSRLFNYARRRNREQEIEEFLLQHTDTKTQINSTKR